MPYSSIKDLPEHVKKYSKVVQRQWLYVFNSVYEQTGGDEGRAFKAANSVLKKRFTKKESMGKQIHQDYFGYLIDSYFKNI